VAVLEALGKRIPELPPAIPRIQVAKDLDKTLIPSEDPLQKRIFIHPGFSKASEQKGYLKSWRVQAWQDFIKGILRRVPDASVYLLGGPEDERLVSKIGQVCQELPPTEQHRFHNLYGQTKNLRDLAGAISGADLLVTVDSFPMHLGVSIGVPIMAIFAATNERKYLPDIPNVVALTRQDLPCRPCLWDRRKRSCENPVCLDVPVAQALLEAERLLNAAKAPTLEGSVR
jgi:putative inorganic carbon (HCO3(-)) transporter